MKFEIQKFDAYPEEQFKSLKMSLRTQHPFLAWQDTLDDKDKAKHEALKGLTDNAWKLRLGVMQNGELIAVCFVFQQSPTEAMMGFSIVRPDFRGQGIYTALCERTLEETKLAGFQAVVSKHMMTNNAILIAKLKIGFKICGMEIHSVHGNLLNMVFNHNALMARSQRFRSGELFLFTEEEIYENYGPEVT